MELETKFNKHQIYGILKDYHWMVREIIKLDLDLQKTEFSGVAQYGIEASMPHTKGVVGKAIENEIVRRSEKSERIYEYAEKVNFIHEHKPNITDEKEKVILDCIMDGLSLTAISKHLNMSRKQITEIRDNIVVGLAK